MGDDVMNGKVMISGGERDMRILMDFIRVLDLQVEQVVVPDAIDPIVEGDLNTVAALLHVQKDLIDNFKNESFDAIKGKSKVRFIKAMRNYERVNFGLKECKELADWKWFQWESNYFNRRTMMENTI